MFNQYRRTGIAEMRPVTEAEAHGAIDSSISISEEDANAGSPKMGDMIARNPKNQSDMWLVAKKYFEDNFEPA